MVVNMRKIVTTARNCGNIWISSNDISPTRRPRNRIRLNAYAARVEMNSAPTAALPAITMELTNHRGNDVPVSSSVTLSRDAPRGTRVDEDSVPSGLMAAETTNTTGKRANATATRVTSRRQPTSLHQRQPRTPTGPPPHAGRYSE